MSKEALERRFAALVAQQDEVLDRLALYEDMPEDEYEDGDIIWFEYRFVNVDFGRRSVSKPYMYAAIKCNGLWYSTGPKAPKAYTWDQMIDWWAAGELGEVWVVTELEQLK